MSSSQWKTLTVHRIVELIEDLEVNSHAQVHGPADQEDQDRWFFVVPRTTNAFDNVESQAYAGIYIDDNLDRWCAATFRFPSGFTSLVHVHPVLVTGGTGNLYRRHAGSHAGNGELYDAHTTTGAMATEAVTISVMTELADISAFIAGAGINDYIGVNFRRDGSDLLDTVNSGIMFYGWLVEYVADM